MQSPFDLAIVSEVNFVRDVSIELHSDWQTSRLQSGTLIDAIAFVREICGCPCAPRGLLPTVSPTALLLRRTCLALVTRICLDSCAQPALLYQTCRSRLQD